MNAWKVLLFVPPRWVDLGRGENGTPSPSAKRWGRGDNLGYAKIQYKALVSKRTMTPQSEKYLPASSRTDGTVAQYTVVAAPCSVLQYSKQSSHDWNASKVLSILHIRQSSFLRDKTEGRCCSSACLQVHWTQFLFPLVVFTRGVRSTSQWQLWVYFGIHGHKY